MQCRFLVFLILPAILTMPAMGARSVEAIEAELAAFQIPPPQGSQLITQISLENENMQQFAERMQAYGVELLLAPGVAHRPVANIRVRNLDVNKVIELAVNSWGGHCMFDDGRMIVFSNPSDLKGAFAKRYATKTELLQALRASKKEAGEDAARSGRVALGKLSLPGFSVEDKNVFDALRALGRALQDNDTGQPIQIVPMFDPKKHPAPIRHEFEDVSVRQILDRLCQDAGLEWALRENRIVVQEAR